MSEPMRILVTCPPMLGMIEEFKPEFAQHNMRAICPSVVQTLEEEELKPLVAAADGWIIGDDPATAEVLAAGCSGRLRAAVKWGVGIDNVDLDAARKLALPVVNTPGMFGQEVADVAMGYVIGLARDTYRIDREIRAGQWPKHRGISLAGKTMGLVGFGDIGRNIAKRARASDLKIIVYDPGATANTIEPGRLAAWPEGLECCDFLVFACALTSSSRNMFNATALTRVKHGLRIVNVARGPLIHEPALVEGLNSGLIASAALDVMADEPLPQDSPLRQFDSCIFGSHNASNTVDAVRATTRKAMDLLFELLGARAV